MFATTPRTCLASSETAFSLAFSRQTQVTFREINKIATPQKPTYESHLSTRRFMRVPQHWLHPVAGNPHLLRTVCLIIFRHSFSHYTPAFICPNRKTINGLIGCAQRVVTANSCAPLTKESEEFIEDKLLRNTRTQSLCGVTQSILAKNLMCLTQNLDNPITFQIVSRFL